MTEKIKAIAAEIRTLQAKNDELAAKANELTAEDVVLMKSNNAAIREKKSTVDTLIEAGQLSDEVRAATETVVNDIGIPDGADYSRKSGEVVLDSKTKDVLFQDGESLMDTKTLSAISSVSYKEAQAKYVRVGEKKMSNAELRTLSEGSDPAGGYLVPPEQLARLLQKQAAPTRLNGLVEQLNASGDMLQMPKVNYTTDDIYTTGVRSTWTGEIPSTSTVHRATNPQFGQKKIDIYTNMLSVAVTNNLFEDSAFPLLSWLTGKFDETIGLLKDNMILNGTGIGQPSGILLNPGGTDQPSTVNVGDPITATGIINLAWSLPEQYEEGAKFVFNKTSVGKAVAVLKDSNNRFLWGQGLQDSGLTAYGPGQKMLAGTPAVFSAFMPDSATAANVFVFGDLRGYALVNRIGFSVQVLREVYAESNQALVLGRIRFGGAVLEPWRLKVGVQS